ncbi:2Fe-2S iron-sulfur cluster binding domain-containing protein [Azohydromonas lata]|uniref:2Fe-2S iron-sulfur cluster binding domain-containing protein n=1 Tax=Azohydromonas lata TaxID=45677 RepID=A0ABU5IMJ8_9BURK|nr:2Fe-2S iron-sulfur cluster binding domain-containing protein [Azohydromonas lata]MDZ5460096.1 2Fe-2S iron-sulfur cluster binding domain-containing protein [Azohydromonas lata]
MTMHDAAASYRVKILDTGETYSCAVTESALHALARTGKRGIPVGCRGGGCGVCKVAVMSGAYDKRSMSRAHVSEEDEARQQVLACCIYPRGDLELQVIGKLKRAVVRKEL